jgi:hypothetical protein
MSDLATSLDAALAELAVDPIGVLRASGVYGLRRDTCNCPVARFLMRRTGRVVVLGRRVKLVGVRKMHRLPARVIEAIAEIDNGKHPELCV